MNKLLLSKGVYEIQNINMTIMAFKDIARIGVYNDGNDYYLCSFDDCEYDVNKTILEFENYLIDLTNKGKI